METILTLLILASFVLFIIGMISPKSVVPFNLPKKRGTAALLYLGLTLVFFIIFGVTSTPEGTISAEQNNPTQQATTETQEQPQQPKQEESAIGKAVKVGYFEYTVNSVRFKKTIGDEFMSETADGIYMLVEISIKNVDTETRTLDGSFFAVTDKDGVKFEFSIDASTVLELSGGRTLFLKECQPRIATKGTLIFEVPEKGEYYLHLIGDFWGDRSVRIPLK